MKCKKCNHQITIGRLLHSQDICWDCFVKDISEIRGILDAVPTIGFENYKEYTHVLNWLTLLAAERYGK